MYLEFHLTIDFQYKQWFTRRNVTIMLVLIWVLAIAKTYNVCLEIKKNTFFNIKKRSANAVVELLV